MTNQVEKKLVHVFVFDTMADWEPAFAMAGINNPEFQLSPGRYQVRTVAERKEPITTMGGVRIQPDDTLAHVSAAVSAMLILPGGDQWESGGNAAAIDKAREFISSGTPVAAICAATGALAKAGLLDDRQHTSNFREYLQATGYRGGNLYCNLPAINDRNVITAAGWAPVDFTYEIYKALGLYSGPALEAWYSLFKNGDMTRFLALVGAEKSA
jgi:putative intracellular protease/amidase